MSKEAKTRRQPTMFEAQFSIWVMVALILVGMLLGMKIHVMMIVSAVIAMIMAYRLGFGWQEMENAISKRVGQLTPVLCNLWAIGLLIGSMMFSGTLPMLIYYGFDVVSPNAIYVTTCLVCMVMSTATGSSWSSAGTAGIVCMTLAEGLGANLQITAGAVICGAVFGDKLSPLSETTNLAPACARTGLYDHIGAMLYTTVPATLIGLVLFFVMGIGATSGGSALPETAVIMKDQLAQLFKHRFIIDTATYLYSNFAYEYQQFLRCLDPSEQKKDEFFFEENKGARQRYIKENNLDAECFYQEIADDYMDTIRKLWVADFLGDFSAFQNALEKSIEEISVKIQRICMNAYEDLGLTIPYWTDNVYIRQGWLRYKRIIDKKETDLSTVCIDPWDVILIRALFMCRLWYAYKKSQGIILDNFKQLSVYLQNAD